MTSRVLLLVVAAAAAISNEEGLAYLAANADDPKVTTLPSGLQYKVLESGPTENATAGSTNPCLQHFVISFINGTVFDSSREREKPSMFMPPQAFYKGWTEALMLMRAGDKWALTLPAELAHGEKPPAQVPLGSVLNIELELIDVRPPGMMTFFGIDFSRYFGLLTMAAYYVWKLFFAPDEHEAKKGKKITLSDASKPDNPHVFFDISIGGKPTGRIQMELFQSLFPKTTENFLCLCIGSKKGIDGKKLHYAGTPFHRVIPEFMCQGGDITNGDGTGGESIYGKHFDDEFGNAVLTHEAPFLLSMANAGRDTNNSQFFFTTGAAPHLDSKHVVFGRVVAGEEVVRAIETVGTGSGRTKQQVLITASGQVVAKPKTS